MDGQVVCRYTQIKSRITVKTLNCKPSQTHAFTQKHPMPKIQLSSSTSTLRNRSWRYLRGRTWRKVGRFALGLARLWGGQGLDLDFVRPSFAPRSPLVTNNRLAIYSVYAGVSLGGKDRIDWGAKTASIGGPGRLFGGLDVASQSR